MLKQFQMSIQITLATGIAAALNHAIISLGELERDFTAEKNKLIEVHQKLTWYIEELKDERRDNSN